MNINEIINDVALIYDWPGQQSYLQMKDGRKIGFNGREQAGAILNAAKAASLRTRRGSQLGVFHLEPVPQPKPVFSGLPLDVACKQSPKPTKEEIPTDERQVAYTNYLVDTIRTRWGLRNPANGRFMRSSYRENQNL